MTLTMNLIVGIIIGWVLHELMPKDYVALINGSAAGLVDKLLGWFSHKSGANVESTKEQSKPSKTRPKSKDDLKKIEGIGPKIAELLNNHGISTYADLGKAKTDKLIQILETAGSRYRIADPSTWSKQAKLAGKGDWDGLKQLKKELKGGRRKN